MSKYKKGRDDLRIVTMFEKAIAYCEYDGIMRAQTEGAMLAYSLMFEGSINCLIVMFADEDGFYVTITHSYYSAYMRLLDINEHVLAYFIRNATKPIDDFHESFEFFNKFFADYAELQDIDIFRTVIENAVEQEIDISYVDPTMHMLKTKKDVQA